MKASSKRYDCKLPDKKLLKSSDCRGQCIQLSKKITAEAWQLSRNQTY